MVSALLSRNSGKGNDTSKFSMVTKHGAMMYLYCITGGSHGARTAFERARASHGRCKENWQMISIYRRKPACTHTW